MNVNIVNYEEGRFNGILSKFAYRMKDELVKLGYDVKVSSSPDNSYSVNHHINYLPYRFENSPDSINTLMVTHIFEGYKFDALKEAIKTSHGICMSDDEREKLIKWGVDSNKLDTVLPAHDGFKRRPYVIAILTNLYPDGCKRVEYFQELIKTIDKEKFAFRIMGKDWKEVLEPMVSNGVQIQYFDQFDYNIHKAILDSSDFYLYMGVDEGSMGALDAKQAGLKLIVPPVGFHKDLKIDYPWNTQEELNKIFKKLSQNHVNNWTWDKYVKNHLKIWKKLK